MPRKPRFFLPDVPVHVVQRGHNREAVFFEDEDYQVYLSRLAEACDKYDCALHAYVLMTNHVHLLMTSSETQGITRLMQYVGRYYVPYINHKYGRSGSLWEGRFKASLIQAEDYLLLCMRYIELNPVRANMVDHPASYPWSSYRFNAQGEDNLLLKPHSLYTSLGGTSRLRQQAYQGLFQVHMEPGTLKNMQSAWQTGTPFGNDAFRTQIERALGKKVGQARRGRPSGFKVKKDEKSEGQQTSIKGL